MKKTRFFYLKKVNVVLLILWIGLINEAITLNLHEKNTEKEKQNIANMPAEDIETEEKAEEIRLETELLKEDVKKIRVLLMDSDYQSYYHPEVSLRYNGKEEIYTMESEALNNGELMIECDGEGICISSIKRQQGKPVYQGTIEIRKAEKGLLLINELPVETYLESVVPSEMPASYEMEALKAQAVCARTYAYKQMEKENLKSFGADVDDSVNYQVYGNVAAQERTSEAVRETEDKVLLQEDELIEAYYFSTSSGKTSTNEIWGAVEAASYLQSVDCLFDADENWSQWKVEIPWEKLVEHFEDFYISGELMQLQANKKNESGAVIELNVITTEGNHVIKGEYEVRTFLSPEGLNITNYFEETLKGGKILPSAYFDMEINAGECVVLYGRGYGHGVGMSQNGADEMAKQGYTWEEILKYFYKNVEIREYE